MGSVNDNISVTSQNIRTHAEGILLSEQAKKNSKVIQLLESWRKGDEQEQRDTLEFLQQSLDEDRTSDRKLFS